MGSQNSISTKTVALKEEMDCPDVIMATQGSLLVIVFLGEGIQGPTQSTMARHKRD